METVSLSVWQLWKETGWFQFTVLKGYVFWSLSWKVRRRLMQGDSLLVQGTVVQPFIDPPGINQSVYSYGCMGPLKRYQCSSVSVWLADFGSYEIPYSYCISSIFFTMYDWLLENMRILTQLTSYTLKICIDLNFLAGWEKFDVVPSQMVKF